MENSIEVCQKLQIELSKVPHLGISPTTTHTHTHKAPLSGKDACTLMYIAAFFFFTITKIWKTKDEMLGMASPTQKP